MGTGEEQENQDVTLLLRAWSAGDHSVAEELFPLVYGELRALARGHATLAADATVGVTALVNEAFIRLAAASKHDWRDRVQFYAFAAVVMRRLSVDYSRQRRAQKRGGDLECIEFDEAIHAMDQTHIDFENLDRALTALEKLDATQARIVELRFFGGLSVDETAQHLGISPRTVNRAWGMAKVWLAEHL